MDSLHYSLLEYYEKSALAFVTVDALTPVAQGQSVVFPWQLILGFVGLKLLQGGGSGGQGILNNIRTFLWIRVQQYTTREIQVGLKSDTIHLALSNSLMFGKNQFL